MSYFYINTNFQMLFLLLLVIWSTVLASDIHENGNILDFYKSPFGQNPNLAASSSVSITNLTTLAGKAIYLNCTLGGSLNNLNSNSRFKQFNHNNENDDEDNDFFVKLNPTWLKADPIYNQFGLVNGFKTENIIVTRKGMIADAYKSKLRLINSEQNSRLLVLRISDVEIRDEGKYICREFNSQLDKLFYLNVYSPIKDLSLKLQSSSKYFREVYTNNIESLYSNILDNPLNSANHDNHMSRDQYEKSPLPHMPISPSLTSNTISIRENDELVISCNVNSSKPAANLSLWVLKRPLTNYHKLTRRNSILDNQLDNIKFDDEYSSREAASLNDDIRKLDILDKNIAKNRDLTLRTSVTSKLVVNRHDNHKLVACIGENTVLNEKWETKKILNVLYSPKCSKYQKMIYNTGINQTVELECHMTEANPPYLDFTWNLLNSRVGPGDNKDNGRVRSNGFMSRISFTPRSERDFGEIACLASNGLDFGECKMKLQLGGPPNPPYDCYHKENNKTIIIECKPGFEQGDPEIYYYLLKKKSNGVLVEYARKRDSCSFLISNLILEEHLNDFFIYSSNKYGNNKETGAKITIENKDRMYKAGTNIQSSFSSFANNRHAAIIACLAAFLLFLFFLICCLLMNCQNNQHNSSSPSSSSSILSQGNSKSAHVSGILTKSNPNLTFFDNSMYKYSSHQAHYTNNGGLVNGDSLRINNMYKKRSSYEDKLNYLNEFDNQNYDHGGKTHIDKDVNDLYDNHNEVGDSRLSSLRKKPIVNGYATTNSTNSRVNVNNPNRIRSPSLVNNIQDLDMSPRSKHKTLEKEGKQQSLSRGSLIDETDETEESENYIELNKSKMKKEQLFDNEYEDDEKLEYYAATNTNTSNKKFSISRSPNIVAYKQQKLNVWYNSANSANDSNDEYSGILLDNMHSSNHHEIDQNHLNHPKSFLSNKNASNTNSNTTTNTASTILTNGSFDSYDNENEDSILNESRDRSFEHDDINNINNADSNTKLIQWQKSKLYLNETISLDVDTADEKAVGILV